jgi:hypothetical protein
MGQLTDWLRQNTGVEAKITPEGITTFNPATVPRQGVKSMGGLYIPGPPLGAVRITTTTNTTQTQPITYGSLRMSSSLSSLPGQITVEGYSRAQAAEWVAEYLYANEPVKLNELFQAAQEKGLSPDKVAQVLADLEVWLELPENIHSVMADAELDNLLKEEPDPEQDVHDAPGPD